MQLCLFEVSADTLITFSRLTTSESSRWVKKLRRKNWNLPLSCVSFNHHVNHIQKLMCRTTVERARNQRDSAFNIQFIPKWQTVSTLSNLYNWLFLFLFFFFFFIFHSFYWPSYNRFISRVTNFQRKFKFNATDQTFFFFFFYQVPRSSCTVLLGSRGRVPEFFLRSDTKNTSISVDASRHTAISLRILITTRELGVSRVLEWKQLRNGSYLGRYSS